MLPLLSASHHHLSTIVRATEINNYHFHMVHTEQASKFLESKQELGRALESKAPPDVAPFVRRFLSGQ